MNTSGAGGNAGYGAQRPGNPQPPHHNGPREHPFIPDLKDSFTQADLEDPVMLDCLHTFSRSTAKECIQADGNVACPKCAYITVLKVRGNVEHLGPNLPIARTIAQYCEKFHHNPKSKHAKEIDPHRAADLMFAPQEIPIDPDYGQLMDLFDLVEQRPVCAYALIDPASGSRNHPCVRVRDAAHEVRNNIESSVMSVQDKVREFENAERTVEQQEPAIEQKYNEAMMRLSQRFQEAHMALDRRYAELYTKLTELKNAYTETITGDRDYVGTQKAHLRNAAESAYMLAKSCDDSELLQHKAAIEGRLSDVYSYEVPASSQFMVTFREHFDNEQTEKLMQTISSYGSVSVTGSLREPTLRVVDPPACVQSVEACSSGWAWPMACSAMELFVGNQEGDIQVYNIHTLEHLGVLEGHSNAVYALEWVSGMLYSVSADRTLKSWDVQSRSCRRTIRLPTEAWTLGSSGRFLYVGSADYQIHIYDITTAQVLTKLQGHKGRVLSMCSRGRRLFTGASDGGIVMWNLTDNGCINGQFPPMSEVSHGCEVWAVAVSGDTLYSGGADGQIRAWDAVSTLQEKKAIRAHDDAVRSLIVTTSHVISASCDGIIKFWKKGSLELDFTLAGHESFVYDLLVTNDRLFSSSQDSTVRMWA